MYEYIYTIFILYLSLRIYRILNLIKHEIYNDISIYYKRILLFIYLFISLFISIFRSIFTYLFTSKKCIYNYKNKQFNLLLIELLTFISKYATFYERPLIANIKSNINKDIYTDRYILAANRHKLEYSTYIRDKNIDLFKHHNLSYEILNILPNFNIIYNKIHTVDTDNLDILWIHLSNMLDIIYN